MIALELIATLSIEMSLFSKARPRVTSRGTFMPKAYKDKQKEMLRQVKEQWQKPPLEGPIRVELEAYGEGRADTDNIAGALFDSLNKVLWVDDRVAIIPELEVKWKKAAKADSKWLVKLYSLD